MAQVGSVTYFAPNLRGMERLIPRPIQMNRRIRSLTELNSHENLKNDYNTNTMSGCVQSVIGRNLDMYA